MKKPSRLKKGDTIAVVALSSGIHSIFPHILDKGIERLENEFGYKIKRGDTLSMGVSELYDNPKARAEDLHKQFLDPNVKGVITTIGGNESIRVLPYLDPKIIQENHKFFMGYSDVSTYHTFMSNLDLVSFNGPAVMAGFAEAKKLEEDFIEQTKEFLQGNWNDFSYKKFSRYTNCYMPFEDPTNLERENSNYIDNNDDWHFISGKGKVNGRIYGGCIEVLEMIKGTDFWPNKDFWKGKVLFLETSEDKPTPSNVEHMLRNYGAQGILSKINALLFSRARDYTEEEKIDLEKVILKVMKEFDREDLMVVTNVDFGHTDPQIIMPNGINIEIDSNKKSLKLTESIWRD